MKKTLILSAAAIGLIAAPVAMSQVLSDRPIANNAVYQPVQFASGNQSAMTYDARRGVLTMAPLLERVTPAVVSINTLTESQTPQMDDERLEMFERFFGQSPRQRGPRSGLGSGVIVDASKGLILTNNHVIDGADEIEITLEDRREFMAEVVGTDPNTDLALLKIEARNLKDLDIAETDDVMVGDYVIAVGNPFNLSSTVTSGIVSGLGREHIRNENSYADYIQTDAAINPGNSGGALVNSKGELIGINTAIVSSTRSSAGIGFAVPTRTIRNVIAQLEEFGEVRRGRIGVSIGPITPEIRDGLGLPSLRGALVSDVVDDSPAEKAGLESGDVIIAFNGEEMDDNSDLRNAVGLLMPGTDADITYLRDGQRRTTRIEIEPMDNDEPRSASLNVNSDDMPSMEGFDGATISDIPADMDLRDGNEGVFIMRVERGSRAARSGLRRGDVIRAINSTDVRNLNEFQDFMDANDGPYAVIVERNGQTAFLGLR